MTTIPHENATELFNVHSGTTPSPYVADQPDRCMYTDLVV